MNRMSEWIGCKLKRTSELLGRARRLAREWSSPELTAIAALEPEGWTRCGRGKLWKKSLASGATLAATLTLDSLKIVAQKGGQVACRSKIAPVQELRPDQLTSVVKLLELLADLSEPKGEKLVTMRLVAEPTKSVS